MSTDTMPAPSGTTVKSGKYGPFNQTKREATTRWEVGSNEAGGKVAVTLHSSHRPESKRFSAMLTWETVEPTEPGSVFSVTTWSSDHAMVTIAQEPVARYSVKALEAFHAAALATVEAAWAVEGSRVRTVFAEAQAATEES